MMNGMRAACGMCWMYGGWVQGFDGEIWGKGSTWNFINKLMLHKAAIYAKYLLNIFVYDTLYDTIVGNRHILVVCGLTFPLFSSDVAHLSLSVGCMNPNLQRLMLFGVVNSIRMNCCLRLWSTDNLKNLLCKKGKGKVLP